MNEIFVSSITCLASCFCIQTSFQFVFRSLVQFENACLYLQLLRACILEVFTAIANLGIAIIANGNLFCPL